MVLEVTREMFEGNTAFHAGTKGMRLTLAGLDYTIFRTEPALTVSGIDACSGVPG